MMQVDYSWDDDGEIGADPNGELLIKMIRRSAELAGLDIKADWIVDVRFVLDDEMADINLEFVGHEGTTDVITFSYFDDMDSMFPGDVGVELIIGLEVAKAEGCERDDSSFEEELALYISHGFLHAAGEDDLEPEACKRMRKRESEVMTELRKEFNLAQVFGVK